MREIRRGLRPLVLIATYVAAARLTRSFTLESGFSPWYPPAGIVLSYLVVVGPRAALTVFVARLVNIAILFPDVYRTEADGVVARAVAITACYTAAAVVLRRVRLQHTGLRDLGWFVAVGVVGAPLGASLSVAAVSATLLGEDASSAFESARTVWVGDAVAVATITPAVLLVVGAIRGLVPRPRLPATSTARLEVGLQTFALIVAPTIALAVSKESSATGFLALALVPVVWVAIKGDVVLAAIGLLVVNVSLSTVAGSDIGGTPAHSELQAVMLAAALASLYVVAVSHTHEMAMADLMDSEERYRSLLTAAPDMVVRFDAEGRCTATSEPAWLRHGAGPVLAALDRAWGGTGRAVLADGEPRTIELAVHADHEDQFLLARLVAEHHADGSRSSVLAVVSDLTAHREALAQLDYERRHDALTGLVNRTRFLEGLEELVGSGSPVALAIADLDDFLAVNDRFGHERGDAVLRDVAERLQRVAGPEAIVGRLGADQFAVALATDEEPASALGAELVRALRIPVVGDAGSLLITGSVGMAVGAGAAPRALLRDADAAMSAAKEAGRDQLVLLDGARRDGTLDRRAMLTYLRVCLANHDLVVHYQPIVDLTSLEVLNVEALVRLPDPERGGLIFPASFIPLAEESGLDVELGAQVLDQALGELARIPRGPGQDPLTMSVNITARQLALPDYGATVVAACERHGVDPKQLCLELTETLVMADPDSALGALRDLRAMGITIALDDFGVGYSSILYLQRFPVDILKIDRAFVSGLPDDADGRAIVRLVVSLADALGLRVTVEGIETEAQRSALVELGCRAGQGYLFARPAPISDLPLLIGDGSGQR